MNIYVGNLSRNVTEDDLKQVCEAFGDVASVNIIKDRYSYLTDYVDCENHKTKGGNSGTVKTW